MVKRTAPPPAEKSPRGLLDAAEHLGEERKRRKAAKAKRGTDLDLDRIG
ncbi:MAG TPA: hypothetical protein VI796_03265 [Candidatus Thermoplasmatota archaeon]|nr:hypothetical protein [Candidatus Thermoplasmatota archaeon]